MRHKPLPYFGFLTVGFLAVVLGSIMSQAWAQDEDTQDQRAQSSNYHRGGNSVRICDETGCSYRSKDEVTTETVQQIPPSAMIRELKTIASRDPRAAFDLGLRYFRGDGVDQNSYKALQWMRAAAQRGNLNAQKAVGVFYLYGLEEMGPDAREAEKWLMLAVAHGDKESQVLLDQARKAKIADQEDFKARQKELRDKQFYLNNWNSGYAYYGVWQTTYWVFN